MVSYSKNGMTWVKATKMHTYVSNTVQFSGYESGHQEMVVHCFLFISKTLNTAVGLEQWLLILEQLASLCFSKCFIESISTIAKVGQLLKPNVQRNYMRDRNKYLLYFTVTLREISYLPDGNLTSQDKNHWYRLFKIPRGQQWG